MLIISLIACVAAWTASSIDSRSTSQSAICALAIAEWLLCESFAFGGWAPIALVAIGIISLGAWPSLRVGQTIVRTGSLSLAMLLFLLAIITSGCILLSALDSATFYLTLELQSYSAVLIASAFLESERSAGASLLYFLVGGFASSLILLGLGLTYAATGCLALSVPETVESSYGLSLLALGLLIKLGAAPVHSWAPIVYDDVPSVIALVLASLPKLPLLFALYLWAASASQFILVSALASLVLGSLLGLSQSRVKRLLALSSVSHTGFILIAIVMLDFGSMSLYAGQYVLATIWAFGLVLSFGYTSPRLRGDLGYLAEFQGIGLANPALATGLVLVLLNLGGVPPLLGFFAKAIVLLVSLEKGALALAGLACLTSVWSMAFYLRFISHLLFVSPQTGAIVTGVPVRGLTLEFSLAMATLTVGASCYGLLVLIQDALRLLRWL